MKGWLKMLCVMMAAGGVTACTEVDLCYSGHPHRSTLDFRFHWPEEYAGNRPDSMRVVAVRPINLLRYEFVVSAEAEKNGGQLLFPDEERQPLVETADDGTVLPPTGNDNLWVRSGEYNFAAFGWDAELFESDVDMLSDDGETAAAEGVQAPVYLSYRHYAVDSPELTARYGTWKDYNAYSEYILGGGMPIYYANVERVAVPVSRQETPTVTVDFTPYTMTQKVSFVFHLEKTPDVMVDSLVAEIAGVPAVIDLTSGLVKADTTYKMLFRADYPALPAQADSLTATTLQCEGTVNVTGVVRSYNEDMLTGPGILQIAVYARCEDNGRQVYKVFHAGINLYNTLRQMELLDYDEATGCYRQTCREAVIDVDAVLHIDRDKVTGSGSASTGLDYWLPGETIVVEV